MPITLSQARQNAINRRLNAVKQNAASANGNLAQYETQTEKPKNNGGFWGGVGYTLGKAGTGLLRGLEGIWDFVAGGIADLFGADEWAQEQMENSPFDKWNEELDAWYNPNGVMEFVGDVAGGVGQMLPSIAVTAATGGAGAPVATGMFMTSAAGQSVSDAVRESGVLGGKEWLYGTASGAVEGAIEGISGGIGGTRLGTVLGKQVAKSTAGKVASAFVGEGLEEVASDLIDPALRRVTGVDPDATVDVSQLPNTFLVGGTAGAVLGGGSRLVNARRAGGFNNLNAAEDANAIREARARGNTLQAEGRLTDKWADTLSKSEQEAAQRLSTRLQRMNADTRAQFIEQNNLGDLYDANGVLAENTVAEPQGYNHDAISYSARNLVGRTDANGNSVLKYAPTQNAVREDIAQAAKDIAKLSNGNSRYVVVDTLTVPESGQKANAFYDDETGIMYIANDADASDARSFVVSHEYVHSLEGSGQYSRYANEVLLEIAQSPEYRKKYNYDEYYARYKRAHPNVQEETLNYIVETEMVADFTAKEILTNESAIRRLANRDASLVRRIYEWVKEKIRQLSTSGGSRESVAYLRKAERLLAKAMDNPGGGIGVNEMDKYVREEKARRDTKEKDTEAETAEAGEARRLAEVRMSIQEVDGKPIVVIDTDQDIFDGVERSEYGKIVRDYMREHFRGQTINGIRFNSRSEKEYTMSGDSQGAYRQNDGRYETKMRAGTELANLIQRGTFIGHEDAKHPHTYNAGGYNRYSVEFILDDVPFSGEMLVALNGEYGAFYDIVKIKRNGSTIRDVPKSVERASMEESSSTNNSIRDNAKNVKGNGQNSDKRFSLSKTDNKGRSLSEEQQEFFKDSKIRETDGRLKTMYHGTGRADRVGNVFRPDRATSGPMAFFTDNEEIAGNYSRNKQDTSLAYDSDYDSYKTQFRVKTKYMDLPLHRAWGYLSKDAQQRIQEKAGHVRIDWDSDDGSIIYDTETNNAGGGFQDQIRWARGNVLEALEEQWLESGNLFREENKFLDVLEMSGVNAEFEKRGMGKPYYKDPDYREEKVYEVYLNVKKPFNTENANERFLKDLQEWWSKQDESKYEVESASADLWDKNNFSFNDWTEKVYDDIQNNLTNAWTSIPDFVTDYLKSKGHDGIIDKGGKQGGDIHTVVIPFSSEQVKNVTNTSPTINPDIRYSLSAIDDYTEKQYNDYGWVRVNDVLSDREYTDFNRKMNNLSAEIKRGKTASGEYIIPVNDMKGERFGVDNVLVFAKGTYQNPKVTRVIRIDFEDKTYNNETNLTILREYIYEQERQDNEYASIIEDVYPQAIISRYTKENIPSYQESKIEWRRRSSGNESGGIDGTDREVQDGRGDSRSDQRDVRYSVSQNRDDNYVTNRLKSYTYSDVDKIVENLTIDKYGEDVVLRHKKNIGKQIYSMLNEVAPRNRKAEAEKIARRIVYQELATESLLNAEEIENARRDGIEISETWIDKKLSSQLSTTENEAFVRELRDELLQAFETTGKLNDTGRMYLRYKDIEDRLRTVVAKEKVLKTARKLKKKNYPLAFDGFDGVKKALSKIEYRSDINKSSTREIVAAFGQFYTAQNEALDGYYSNEVREAIDNFLSYNGEGNLDLYELEQLDTILIAADHLLRSYDKAFLGDRTVSVTNTAQKEIAVVKENAPEYGYTPLGRKGMLGSALRSIVDMRTLMRWVDGGNSGIMTELFEQLAHGSTVQTITVMDLNEPFEAFIKENKKFYKELDKNITFKFNGVEAEITRAEAISLYLTSLQEDGLYHLAFGGFTVGTGADLRRKYNGKKPFYGDQSDVEAYEAEALREIKADMSALYEQFNTAEKEYIRIARDLFNNKAKRIKQDVDMKRMGITNARVENYFPMRVYERGSGAQKPAQGFIQELNLIANQSIHKDRVKGSKQTLMITPVNMVIMNHIRQIAMYNAYAIPLDTFRRILNKNVAVLPDGKLNTAQAVTLKTTIQENAWGDFAKFIERFEMDVQGANIDVSTFDKVFRWIRSNYAKFQLGLNIKTMASQLTSLPMVGGRVGWGNLLKGTFAKVNLKEMFEYSEWARARAYEGAAYKSQALVDNLDTIGQLAMKPIGWVDMFTMNRIYNAAKYYVASRDHLSLDSVECKTKAAKLLEELGRETQNNSEVAERSAIMRSRNEIVKSIVMFSSDAMKQFSTLVQALNKISFIKRKLKRGIGDKAMLEKELKTARREARQAFASVATSMTFYVLMGMLINYGLFAKEPEDDETMVSIFLENLGGSVTGMIPLVRELYSFFVEGYELDNFAYDTFNGLTSAVKNVFDLFARAGSGERVTNQEWMLAMRKFIYAAGQVTGLPTRNIYNAMYGLIKRFSPSAAYEINSLFYGASTGDLSKAIEKGDDKLANTITQQLLADKGIDVSESVAEVFADLYEQGYSLPKGIPESFTYNDEEYILNAKQSGVLLDAYATASEKAEGLVNSEDFAKLSDDEKANALKLLFNYYYYAGLNQATGTYGDNRTLLLGEAIDISKIAVAYGQLSELKADTDREGNAISGTKKAKVQRLVNSMRLTAAQKYILMGFLGYKNANGENTVKNYVRSLGLSEEGQLALLEMCGYDTK